MLSKLPFALLGCLVASIVSAQDTPLTMVLMEGKGWEQLADGFKFTEGPAADRNGNVYFTDVRENKIHKIDVDGKLTLFAENTSKTNGLMFGPDGRLYGCRNGDKSIVAYSMDGSYETLAKGVTSNDIVVNSKGDLYFTDPPKKQVWFLPKGGEARTVAEGFRPNGVILTPDQSTLAVTDSDEPHLWTFTIQQDGSLAHRERYYSPLVLPPGKDRPGSDGMTIDDLGRLFVATYAGVQMFDPTGRPSGVILKPQSSFLSNVVFGGRDFKYMYVTCSDKIYRRLTKTTGTPTVARTANRK